jgi:hypothetical protein
VLPNEINRERLHVGRRSDTNQYFYSAEMNIIRVLTVNARIFNHDHTKCIIFDTRGIVSRSSCCYISVKNDILQVIFFSRVMSGTEQKNSMSPFLPWVS